MNYQFAVVEGYGLGGPRKRAISLHNSREAAIKKAERETNTFRRQMARYGWSSGEYLAIRWNLPDDYTWIEGGIADPANGGRL